MVNAYQNYINSTAIEIARLERARLMLLEEEVQGSFRRWFRIPDFGFQGSSGVWGLRKCRVFRSWQFGVWGFVLKGLNGLGSV